MHLLLYLLLFTLSTSAVLLNRLFTTALLVWNLDKICRLGYTFLNCYEAQHIIPLSFLNLKSNALQKLHINNMCCIKKARKNKNKAFIVSLFVFGK